MRRDYLTTTTLLLLASLTTTSSASTTRRLPFPGKRLDDSNAPHNIHSPYAQALSRRSTDDVGSVAGKNFDFVIVGGGVAGLALATRLSEWTNTTILLLEAGTNGSEYADQIAIPGKSYLGSLTGTSYDWQYETTAQSSAGGEPRKWPRGKGLGGSGAINGMFWCRAGAKEYDAWDGLQGSGAISWGWDTMKKYMIKSETYTPMPTEQASNFSLEHDPSSHGTSGPIHSSYSLYQFPLLATWIPTLAAIGLQHTDPAGGTNHGAAFVPSTINPANQSRSDSTAGYYIGQGAVERANLVVLTGQQAVRLVWNSTTGGNATVGGVVFAGSAGAKEETVYANKEVIISGGTVGSPQLLQLSGVGPKALVTGLGIDSVVDLPGVGQNLQDHVSTNVGFSSTANPTWSALTDPTLAASELTKWHTDGSGMWSYLNEATAYPSLQDLMGADAAASWAANVNGSLDATLTAQVGLNAMDGTVQAGVKAQHAVTAAFAGDGDVGQVEIIFNMLGGTTGAVGIQVALQRAFSRGTIQINSASAFTPPTINPNYFSSSFDLDIMRAGVKYLTKIGQTAPLSDHITAQTAPARDASDDDIDKFVTTTSGTEYHPCGSCSMLPRELGGVVDTKLVVYGTSNLRIVDASIIPLHIAAHLMGTTYGIAEHAADIIKSAHVGIASSTSSASGTATGTESAGATSTGATEKSAVVNLSTGAKVGIAVAAIGALGFFGALIWSCRRKPAKPKPQDLWQAKDTDPAGVYYSGLGHSGGTTSAVPLAPFMQHQNRDSIHSFGSLDSAHPENATTVRYGDDVHYGEGVHGGDPYASESAMHSSASLYDPHQGEAVGGGGQRPYRD